MLWIAWLICAHASAFNIDTVNSPMSGLWWNPSQSGWGMSIAQQGPIMFIGWYTYDAAGNPTRYFMSNCAVSGGACSGDIYRISGGAAPTAPWTGHGPVTTVGSGTLTFSDLNTASFSFTLNGAAGSKTLSRMQFDSAVAPPAIDYTALWWNPNEAGWGVFITHQGSTMFVVLFTYDAAGNPLRYVASNCAVSGNGCSGTLYRTAGGQSPTAPWTGGVVQTAVGTLTLAFSDAANGSMNVTIDGQAGSKTITRMLFAPAAPALALQQVASGMSQPIFLTAPAGDSRIFIVERPGRIRILQDGTLRQAPFLDIQSLTTTEGERGLLSMAFDPQFATNGYFYVDHTDAGGNINVARYRVSAADPNLADPASRLTIITIPHPNYNNHNGGMLAFGPDGYLYIGTGDGGSGGDPPNNAQNLGVLLGKLLRIDVSAASAAQPYAIPPSNPFVNQSGRRGEIWAYGLRNPWRYAIDSLSGLLYIGDVGQDRREEIDVAPIAQGGLNYGWRIMEGALCYPSSAACSPQGLTLPVLDYDHGQGEANGCSIVGGHVYHGAAIPELAGRYFYSDLCGGWLKSMLYLNGAATEQKGWSVADVSPIYSFGTDAQGELYLLSGAGGVYRLVRQ